MRQPLATLLSCQLALLCALPAAAQVKEGQKAPDYGQRDLYDESPTATEYWVSDFVGPDPSRGPCKALLLAFCASYCKPCWEELPDLIKLADDYGPSGLTVWSILVDDDPAGREKGKKNLEPARNKLITTRVGSQTMPDAYLGPTRELPTLVLINKAGLITLVQQKKDHPRLKEALKSSLTN